MKSVSLTYFLDFVLKAGTPKLTVVRNFKHQGEYDPITDFYKGFRDRLTRVLASSGDLAAMRQWVEGVHQNKRDAYRKAFDGLRKFLGRRRATWFDPPKANYSLGAMTVTVNPELGLIFDGKKHVLKLHLKDEKMVRTKADVIVHLMREALADEAGDADVLYGVLDARSGKLFAADPKAENIHALLVGEAASFAAMFGSV